MVFIDEITMTALVIGVDEYGPYVDQICLVCLANQLFDIDPCLAIEVMGGDLLFRALFG